ncbi:MAG TPA: CocE/NonD family hydrolase [Burkholderiales bacterium]|nr:CocE/NonD family hydrolase [Burkholderiales bacterium]
MIRPIRSAAALAAVLLTGCAAPLGPGTAPAARLHEEVVRVPGPGDRTLVATWYKPAGGGPFPLIVLSHGSPPDPAARPAMDRNRILTPIGALVARGYAVLVPMRRGFGATGGAFAEGYGTCANPDYLRAGNEAAKDILAAMAYGQAQGFVQRDTVLLVGQSLGGYASIAAASRQPRGLVAVINFSGGNGGRPATTPGDPCRPERLGQAFAAWGASVRVPVLWHYVENDQFFAPRHVQSWYEAFTRAGGTGRLVMQPPYGRDGHGVFPSTGGVHIWAPAFDRFVADFGIR